MSDAHPAPADAPSAPRSRQDKRDDADLGVFSSRDDAAGIASMASIGWAAAALWVIVCILAVALAGRLGALTSLVAVFLPLAMIWLVVAFLTFRRRTEAEVARLTASVNSMRLGYLQDRQAGIESERPALKRKLEELAAAQRRTEATLATFTSIRTAGGAAVPPAQTAAPAEMPAGTAHQPSLALNAPGEGYAGVPLSTEDFIRALNFPQTAEDTEGFRSLRRAFRDHRVRQLVQAAQDVLTLLSEDGIYMDDLEPDRARPDVWRQFAEGVRGRAVAAIGGVRDRTSIALSTGRMRRDPIFRDAAHHFLRTFDRVFSDFAKTATDEEIAALAETRSARAFMLLGRVAGTF